VPLSPGYVDYVHELFARFGPVDIKRMFGGAGVYADGQMFAIVDDDVIFLRTDDALEADLKAQGCTPWSYSMKSDGTVRRMGYWSLPESAADDQDEAAALAKRALAAARARSTKRAATKATSKKAAVKKFPAKKTAARKK
jgi:DNA transformation protein